MKNRPIILTGNIDDYKTLGDINYYWKYSALLTNANSDLTKLFNDLFSSTDIFCELYMSRSYNKCLSPYILKNIEMYGLIYVNSDKSYYKLNTETTDNLSKIISSVEFPIWKRLNDVYLNELYDIFKPYNIKTITNNEESFGSKTNISKDITRLNSDDRTNTTKANSNSSLVNRDTITKNRINGFNSTEPVNSDDSSTNEKSSSTDENNIVTNDKNVTKNNEENYTNSDYNRSKTFNDLTYRVGNIGNISLQELLMKEIEVRKYRLQDTILKGLDKYFVTQKYI